ncbi:MAG: M28 family peptidase [Bacteroidales bacterium]|nr:M28 family peptidase [Bacteroidales bacterium]
MLKLIKSFSLILLLTSSLYAQDTVYVRQQLNILCSDKFKGRGYAFHGNSIAAKHISKQLKNIKLQTWYQHYQQKYTMGVNAIGKNAIFDFGESYPAKYQSDMLKIDPCSARTKGKFHIVQYEALKAGADYGNNMICIDATRYKNDTAALRSCYRAAYSNKYKAKGYVILEEKTRTASPGNALYHADCCIVYLIKDSIQAPLDAVKINLDAKWDDQFTCQNVAGYVRGNDTNEWIVIGAHYDHVGMMGKHAIYHGAQDNASGTSMLLDLARYYSTLTSKPSCNILFVFFDGEESGLLGSSYFVKNCPVAISSVKLMINLDLVGNGEEGICICGGENYPEIFEKITAINASKNYLPDIQKRNITPNSDHYSFHKQGCKSLFIYTRGASGPYHHPDDLPQYLNLAGYNGLFKLLTDYISTL